MGNKTRPDETALAFYSKVSASISHELKNALAVINESAGFLEDITLMVKKGRPLDPNQIGALAGTVLKQVQRSNTIIKNMNRLAHSLDEKRAVVELTDTLELMTCLFERIAVNKGVKISTVFPEAPISLTTCPFYLETLIWLLLELSLVTCGEKKMVDITVTPIDAGARIDVSGLETLTQNTVDDLFAKQLAPLLTALNNEMIIAENERRLTIVLPGNIPENFET